MSYPLLEVSLVQRVEPIISWKGKPRVRLTISSVIVVPPPSSVWCLPLLILVLST